MPRYRIPADSKMAFTKSATKRREAESARQRREDHNRTKCRLLMLPAELLNTILEFALPNGTVIYSFHYPKRNKAIEPWSPIITYIGASQVSRILRPDAIRIFYSRNPHKLDIWHGRFAINETALTRRWIQTRPQEAIAAMKNIWIENRNVLELDDYDFLSYQLFWMNLDTLALQLIQTSYEDYKSGWEKDHWDGFLMTFEDFQRAQQNDRAKFEALQSGSAYKAVEKSWSTTPLSAKRLLQAMRALRLFDRERSAYRV